MDQRCLHTIFSFTGAVFLLFALLLPAPAAVRAQEAGRTAPIPVTFNDGWRWAYRNKVIDGLKADIYRDDTLRNEVFRAELGLDSNDRDALIEEADTLFGRLSSAGEAEEASVLESVILFFTGSSDRLALEEALRLHPSTRFEPLGWYLLGDYYERKGFYPEARGFLKRLAGSAPGAARTAALFQTARISYFEGSYEKAKREFADAVDAGSRRARLWLADTLLIKGEFSAAGRIFSGVRGISASLDPVTLLSMGDMAVLNGGFVKARAVFDHLHSRYVKDKFLSTFFALKKGDTFAAEGRRAQALEVYRKVKEMLDMDEGWAMAALSIAGVYAAGPDKKASLTAYGFYSTIAKGGYIGSEAAHVAMAKAAFAAGDYPTALRDATDFPAGYPSSRTEDDMESLTGDIVVRWMDSLSRSGDYYSVIKLYIDYGPFVPFGTKGITYLNAGAAYAALGLYSDAVNLLDSAIRIGTPEVVERAMLTLANVYVDQRDWLSAQRLIKAFDARFPKSGHAAEAGRVRLKAYFIKGDYRKAAFSDVAPDDAEGLLIQAASFSRLDRPKSAIVVYRRAIRAFGPGGGRASSLAAAYTGIGDASFTLGGYAKAISAYRKALENIDEKGRRDRSWALYRIARSYSMLEKEDEKKAALKELETIKGEVSKWAPMIFREEARM
ncbi:MAG: tetratricopeptide repeat protein [Thermodesulfobacteriota bacterium]